MVKNQSLVNQILEMIDTLLEVGEHLLKHGYNQYMVMDTIEMMERIKNVAYTIEKEEPKTRIYKACDSAIYSFKNLIDTSKMSEKLVYEFIPILQEMYMNLYFFGCIYPDKEKMQAYYQETYKKLSSNKFIDKSVEENQYKYDVSISVTGYNKLEYTKICIENLIKNIPHNLSYELILYNHGSTDGTKEYFESICPTKQVDVKVNGAVPLIITRIVEGKYHISVSNDVVVTKNVIKNMVECMKQDSNIKYAVPSTPNISNLQSLDVLYNSAEELEDFVHANNIYNPYRHEQRTRLINPLEIVETQVMYSEKGLLPYSYLHVGVAGVGFGDDKKSLFLRRNGYKMVLLKDAYCHHYGSITLKKTISEIQKEKSTDFYLEGRKDFYRNFHIDPWGKGCCYSPELVELIQFLEIPKAKAYSVLGINCGIGSNSLKVKEIIREKYENDNIYLYNITTEKEYIEDLDGISDCSKYVEYLNYDKNKMDCKFDFIVMESSITRSEIRKLVENWLNTNGYVIIEKENCKEKVTKLEEWYKIVQNHKWLIIQI